MGSTLLRRAAGIAGIVAACSGTAMALPPGYSLEQRAQSAS